MKANAAHHHAQRAWVRMLFDADFAAAVRADPAATLPDLPSLLQKQFAAADPRALRTDPLLQLRTLRHLGDELKISTLLFLHETRSLAALLTFYRSHFFHDAIAQDQPLVLALADFLAHAAREMHTPHFGQIVAIERAIATARRASQHVAKFALADSTKLACAPGIVPLALTGGALAALQAAEKYLFEVNLMPALALCEDAPSLALAQGDAAARFVVTVPLDGKVSLVDIEEPTYLVLAAATGLPLHALVDVLSPNVQARVHIRSLIAELVEAELLVEV